MNEVQLTPTEMEVDIIKELMQAQNQEQEHLKGQSSYINSPVVGVSVTFDSFDMCHDKILLVLIYWHV